METPSQPEPGNWARRFFTIWTGQALSLFGSALVQFALIWWLTQRAGPPPFWRSPSWWECCARSSSVPLPALVDRWRSPHHHDRGQNTAIAAFSLLLAYLFATGTVQIWHIYAVMAVRALGGAFHFPAMSASTSWCPGNNWRASTGNQALQG